MNTYNEHHWQVALVKPGGRPGGALDKKMPNGSKVDRSPAGAWHPIGVADSLIVWRRLLKVSNVG